MIRSSVTISLVPEARGGPFVFWDDLPGACRQAKAMGFDAVEIFPAAAGTLDPHGLQKLLRDHGLKLAAMGTGAGWVKERLHLTLPDADARSKARAFIRSIIDLAGALGRRPSSAPCRGEAATVLIMRQRWVICGKRWRSLAATPASITCHSCSNHSIVMKPT